MRFPFGPALLLALLGTFLLPFLEFSCQGRPAGTVTGYDVAFGAKSRAEFNLGKIIGDPDMARSGPRLELTAENREQRNTYVAAALIAGVLGGVAGFIRPLFGALGGIAAAVLLLVAQADIQKQVQNRDVVLLVVTFREGFWISLGCAAAGGVLCLVQGRKGGP
jgi:hypothetical protein